MEDHEMKISIAKGSTSSKTLYELDSSTNIGQDLYWDADLGSDEIRAFSFMNRKVRGVLSDSGGIYRAFNGTASLAPTKIATSAITRMAIASGSMIFSPGGNTALALSASGTAWISVDFSSGIPESRTQPAGNFPKSAERGMMSFDDGTSRLLQVDAGAGVVRLSTVVGNGAPLNIATTMPIGALTITGNEGETTPLIYIAGSVNCTVVMGRLARQIAAEGLGTALSFDMWIILPGEPLGLPAKYFSAKYTGQASAPSPSGVQTLGFADFTVAPPLIKEIEVYPDFTYSTAYEQAVPFSDLMGFIGFNVAPSTAKQFWSRYVRSFELAEEA
jgi:hypothetical protein